MIENSGWSVSTHFYLLVILSSEQLSIVVYKRSIGSVFPQKRGVGRAFLRFNFT